MSQRSRFNATEAQSNDGGEGGQPSQVKAQAPQVKASVSQDKVHVPLAEAQADASRDKRKPDTSHGLSVVIRNVLSFFLPLSYLVLSCSSYLLVVSLSCLVLSFFTRNP